MAHTSAWIWRVRTDLQEPLSSVESAEDSSSEQEHVMLSYEWSHQASVLLLAEALRGLGYRVWLDVTDMSGVPPPLHVESAHAGTCNTKSLGAGRVPCKP